MLAFSFTKSTKGHEALFFLRAPSCIFVALVDALSFLRQEREGARSNGRNAVFAPVFARNHQAAWCEALLAWDNYIGANRFPGWLNSLLKNGSGRCTWHSRASCLMYVSTREAL